MKLQFGLTASSVKRRVRKESEYDTLFALPIIVISNKFQTI